MPIKPIMITRKFLNNISTPAFRSFPERPISFGCSFKGASIVPDMAIAMDRNGARYQFDRLSGNISFSWYQNQRPLNQPILFGRSFTPERRSISPEMKTREMSDAEKIRFCEAAKSLKPVNVEQRRTLSAMFKALGYKVLIRKWAVLRKIHAEHKEERSHASFGAAYGKDWTGQANDTAIFLVDPYGRMLYYDRTTNKITILNETLGRIETAELYDFDRTMFSKVAKQLAPQNPEQEATLKGLMEQLKDRYQGPDIW